MLQKRGWDKNWKYFNGDTGKPNHIKLDINGKTVNFIMNNRGPWDLKRTKSNNYAVYQNKKLSEDIYQEWWDLPNRESVDWEPYLYTRLSGDVNLRKRYLEQYQVGGGVQYTRNVDGTEWVIVNPEYINTYDDLLWVMYHELTHVVQPARSADSYISTYLPPGHLKGKSPWDKLDSGKEINKSS